MCCRSAPLIAEVYIRPPSQARTCVPHRTHLARPLLSRHSFRFKVHKLCVRFTSLNSTAALLLIYIELDVPAIVNVLWFEA